MSFWTHEELHEIEETLLDRKLTISYTPDKSVKKIEWKYEDWEFSLLSECAKHGYTIEQVSNFLRRQRTDVLRCVRNLGYENWVAYCEAMQGVPKKQGSFERNVSYRQIVEAAMGRPLTKGELIHHVNCDHYDDSLENLWVCKSTNHRHAHASYRHLQKALIAYGVIVFNRDTGDYDFNIDAVDDFYDFWSKPED